MKLGTRRENLLEACRLAGRLLPERPIDPVSAHFLLDASPRVCSLRADDHEVALCLPLQASVEEPGKALVAARAALAILRETTAEELTLEAHGGSITLRGPGVRFQLEMPSPSSFPPQDLFPVGPALQIEGASLFRAIRSTLFAAGPGSRRYRLDGVLWELSPGRLRLVASDNKRLAVAELPALGGCESQNRRVLPIKAMFLLARLAAGAEGPVEAVLGPERAHFRAAGGLLSCRYMEGVYPDWRKVIPAAPPHRLELPVEGLLSAVRQAAALRGTSLVLRLEPGLLVLESGQPRGRTPPVGRKVPFTGGPVQVSVNPRFVVEVLRCLEGEERVSLELTDADTAALFRVGDHYLHVLMPLKFV